MNRHVYLNKLFPYEDTKDLSSVPTYVTKVTMSKNTKLIRLRTNTRAKPLRLHGEGFVDIDLLAGINKFLVSIKVIQTRAWAQEGFIFCFFPRVGSEVT